MPEASPEASRRFRAGGGADPAYQAALTPPVTLPAVANPKNGLAGPDGAVAYPKTAAHEIGQTEEP